MKKRKESLEAIKNKLIERRHELEEELIRREKEDGYKNQLQDLGDMAVYSSMEILRNSLQDTERGEINKIVKALEMIEVGNYGICIDCNNPISIKRLESYPNATRCIVCQEDFEEKMYK